MELYEDKEIMKKKDHANEVEPTTACCLQSTKPWQHTGRIDIGDF